MSDSESRDDAALPEPSFFDIPTPAGYRRSSWGEVQPGDAVWLLGLRPLEGDLVEPAAFGPYVVLGRHQLQLSRDGQVIQEFSDGRLLLPVGKCLVA